MNSRPVRAILLLAISLAAGMMVADSPVSQFVPKAHAAVPGSSALLGFFDEGATFRSSAVVSPGLIVGSFVKFDVNVTGAGAIKGIIVQFNWTASALSFSNSSAGNYVNFATHSHSNPWCPASQGCLFDGLSPQPVVQNQTSPGGYYLALTDFSTTKPTVSGTGILFRIAFKVANTNQHTVIHIQTTVTQILNPGPVPYQNIDGYFDNSASTVLNYPISASPVSLTVTRPVTGTVTSGGATITLGTFSGAGSVSFSALGLPKNTPPLFSPNTACSAACTTTFTVTVNGGPASSPSTTPSGNYTIALVTNATTGAPGMVKETWLKLIIKPPAASVFTLSASTSTKFSHEAGTFNLFSLSATLTSGANDSLTESSVTCLGLQLVCALTPTAGQFNPTVFGSSLNVSSAPGIPTGVYRFNITATTTGTYSEVSVTVPLTFTVTITQTHDLVTKQESMPKLFSYEGVSLVRPSGHPINMTATFVNQGTATETFTVNATAKANLSSETPNNITFVDLFSVGFWKPGDTVIHDIDGQALNGSRTYDASDIIINGTAPSLGTHLVIDTNIKWVDNNFDGKWDCFSQTGNVCKAGKTVIDDANANGVYDRGDIVISGAPPLLGYQVSCVASVCPAVVTVSSLQPAEPVVSGIIANGTSVSTDTKIKFWDLNGNSIYGGGQESVIYDSNNNGVFDASDPHIKFIDTNFNGTWDCTTIAVNTCTAGEKVVYDSNNNGKYDTGEPVILGGTATVGATLLADPKIRYVDSNANGVWDTGEPVVYDRNNNGIYDSSDLIIAGTPTLGQTLKGEPVISGLAPPSGTALATDSKLRFQDANSDSAWDNNEAVVYDLNSLTTFFNGARSVTINIDPENAPHGKYTIFAYALPVSGEINLANNGLGIIAFTQKLRGDVTGDCKVNIFDLTSVAGIFGVTAGSAGYNIAADLNNDGIINIFDLSLVGGNFGANC